MTITLTREALREGVTTVAGVLKDKISLPILGSILFEPTEDGLQLTATNLDQTIQTTVPADVNGKEVAFTVPGKRLVAVAKQLPDAAVRLSNSKGSVKLDCAKIAYDLPALKAEEFPNFPPVDFAAGWSIPGNELAEVKRVSFATLVADSRPWADGVFWQCRNGRMRLVATDGHRLVRLEAGSCCEGQRDLLVPHLAMESAAQLFAKAELVTIATSENWLGFRDGGTVMLTRVITDAFPNYEQLFPREYERRVRIDREDLMAVAKRLAVVSETPYKVTCAFAKGVCVLSVQTPDVGKGREEIACDFDGSPFEIAFNLNYLIEGASHFEGEAVQFSFNSPSHGALLQAIGADEYIQFIMPMRVID